MCAQQLIADRYSLVEPLSGSGTGFSWRGQDVWSAQVVTITRVPLFGLAGDELLRARGEIAGEVRALGGVQHDRLVRAVDVVVDADELWVASEPLPGVTLADELARRGTVSPGEVARWGRDVADGLTAAHAAGVIHRNLHAGMVGLAEDGWAVVGGFATTVVTGEGVRSGTPVHVAPEVAQGAPPSPAADVFALGMVLSIAVEGRGPFPTAVDRSQLVGAVTVGTVTAPHLTGQLGDLLMRMLKPDPAQRPSAAAVADQLRQLAEAPADVPAGPGPAAAGRPPYRAPLPWAASQPGGGTPEPPGPGLAPAVPESSTGQRTRMRWLVAAAVLVVLALAGGLLVVLGPWTSGLLSRSAEVSALPPPIGDPRTVDPCSLLSISSVQRFGQATVIRDISYPQECDIYIGTGGEGFVWLSAMFGVADDLAPPGVVERYGQLTISREAASGGKCGRTVMLADRSRVYVTAEANGGAATDLCAVADAGTQTAVVALSNASLPRRATSDPPDALTWLDTCSLLDQVALKQVPGLYASQQDPGFARWLCIWGDNPAFLDEPWVKVAVEHVFPLSGQAVQIGGRSAQVTPGGGSNKPGYCVVRLVQRNFTESSGSQRVEVLQVTVSLGAQQSSDSACRSATALAEAAAPTLPAPA